MTGDVAGTPAFMAPEQITHYREAMPATDLYAVGATLYNLLTNCYVYDFPAVRPKAKYLMILQDDPVPIRKRRRDIPKGLASHIDPALAGSLKTAFLVPGRCQGLWNRTCKGCDRLPWDSQAIRAEIVACT